MTVNVGETTPLLPETAPLLAAEHQEQVHTHHVHIISTSSVSSYGPWKQSIFLFLEAKTSNGQFYERAIVWLIWMNVVAFIIGSMYIPEYNDGRSCHWMYDLIFFGNTTDNGLQWFLTQILWAGPATATSLLELVTILIFTVEYFLRIYVCDLIFIDNDNDDTHPYTGWWGRAKYMWTFFPLVDLMSIVPFFVDAYVFRSTDISSTAWVRMFRLLRMMRSGKYATSLQLMERVWKAQKDLFGTALFVGLTTWMTVASCYYIVERRNPAMIYCPISSSSNDDNEDDLDMSKCQIDDWGFVTNCPEDCFNMYQSIPSSCYYTLLNLFGEFPFVDQHSPAGQVVGTFTAVVAVGVFALPAGIIGNGLEDQLEIQRKEKLLLAQQQQQAEGTTALPQQEQQDQQQRLEGWKPTKGFVANAQTPRGWWYNVLFAQTIPGSIMLDYFINALIVGTAVSFMLSTVVVNDDSYKLGDYLDTFDTTVVMMFTLEYALRVYAIQEDPQLSSTTSTTTTIWPYVSSFFSLVDLLAIVPFWIQVAVTGSLFGSSGTTTTSSTTTTTLFILVKVLRLFRILRFEKYTRAFTSFDDVLWQHWDVLTITAFAALLFWIFFAAWLYITECNNPDPEMAANYNNMPNSLWMTLLNLSGEAPLAHYSVAGQVATGLLGLFATGVFGIPIGILGAGFEEIVEEENNDNVQELEQAEQEEITTILQRQQEEQSTTAITSEEQTPLLATTTTTTASNSQTSLLGTPLEQNCHDFVNGIGSASARRFETTIYILIFAAVGLGVLQTVQGHENDLSQLETVAVIVFTVEYTIRLIGVGADPMFATTSSGPVMSRLRFVISFYSVVDLLAIVPYYLTLALPGSIVDEYDEYLRMCRIIRLVKLDKYIPSITLIDDVIRLKYNALKVTFFAAVTMWMIFAAFLYMFEHDDTQNDLDDPVPLYGCIDNCTMADRFQNFFDSMVYTGIHLTGDYPITTYTWPARFVNFFMVIAAVGIVSIPSALIASGFVEIVQSKAKARRALESGGLEALPTTTTGGVAGDDWYDVAYRDLEDVDPPASRWGPMVDNWQNRVNTFLNGTPATDGHTLYTPLAFAGRIFIFSVIITNIMAVLAESIPSVDKSVGNDPGNFFDVFEKYSVMIFTAEYLARLFCAPKNRQALYSSWVYATTFFGIVDVLSIAPWYIQQALVYWVGSYDDVGGDNARVFRMFRIFRILQLEDFITAFSKLDNVFRASKDILKATGLMAIIIWVGCGALFFIFEQNNPNWRQCDDAVPSTTVFENNTDTGEIILLPGCYDFRSTAECNAYYPDLCDQKVFINMPNTLYLTAVFLGGEWGVVDFTWPGRIICLFLCVVGIGLYAIPIGALFDSFGAVLGLAGDDDDDEEEEAEEEVAPASS